MSTLSALLLIMCSCCLALHWGPPQSVFKFKIIGWQDHSGGKGPQEGILLVVLTGHQFFTGSFCFSFRSPCCLYLHCYNLPLNPLLFFQWWEPAGCQAGTLSLQWINKPSWRRCLSVFPSQQWEIEWFKGFAREALLLFAYSQVSKLGRLTSILPCSHPFYTTLLF